MPPGRADPGSAPGGPYLRHRTRRPSVRGRCHASVPGGSGRVGALDTLRHLRGSAGLHRRAPSRGSHSGHVRCAGSPERITRSTRRLSPRFGPWIAVGPWLPSRESPRIPLLWGRRFNLARTPTCGPTRDPYSVLDRRSAPLHTARRQSSSARVARALPGQRCRHVDRRGAPIVVLDPAGLSRPEPDLWGPRGSRTGDGFAGARRRARPGVNHRGPCCAAHFWACAAVPWIAGVTVTRGRRASPGPVTLELPGTRAECRIAGAYPRVSPAMCAPTPVAVVRAAGRLAGSASSRVDRREPASSADRLGCGAIPTQSAGPALVGPGPDRTRAGRRGRSRTAPRAPIRGAPVGSVGPSARKSCLPRRPPPGQWPPRLSAGGGTGRHLPSTIGRTRIGSRPAGRAAGATPTPPATSPPAVHPVNCFMGRRTWHSPPPAAHPGLVPCLACKPCT